MKKYEYKIMFIRDEINQIRKSDNPMHDIPDHVLLLDVINREGSAGWKCLNPWDSMSTIFEREMIGNFFRQDGMKVELSAVPSVA